MSTMVWLTSFPILNGESFKIQQQLDIRRNMYVGEGLPSLLNMPARGSLSGSQHDKIVLTSM